VNFQRTVRHGALVQRAEARPSVDLARVRVVLVRPALARNIGASARAMKNMGLSTLYLVQPEQFPHADANALAAGADDVLQQAQCTETLAQALSGCVAVYGTSARRRSIELPTLAPETAARQAIVQLQQSSLDVAIVFGAERIGLENAELLLCQARVEIPCDPAFSSLNLSQAVQICSYEMRRAFLDAALIQSAASSVTTRDAKRFAVDSDAFEHFFAHLSEVLGKIDFYGSKHPEKVLARLRRLYQRAAPDARELQILRGVLTETERSLERKREEP
jgi:tRNA (cytidine32/uridine32-2'-O)-methyltransferase